MKTKSRRAGYFGAKCVQEMPLQIAGTFLEVRKPSRKLQGRFRRSENALAKCRGIFGGQEMLLQFAGTFPAVRKPSCNLHGHFLKANSPCLRLQELFRMPESAHSAYEAASGSGSSFFAVLCEAATSLYCLMMPMSAFAAVAASADGLISFVTFTRRMMVETSPCAVLRSDAVESLGSRSRSAWLLPHGSQPPARGSYA